MTDRNRVANALALHPTDKLIDPVLELLAEIRAEEREACGALLGNEVLSLVSQGEHDEASIVARCSMRIRKRVLVDEQRSTLSVSDPQEKT